MSMAKFKLDSEQIKKFMIERGEKVGLGLAVAIMALFLLMGVWTALASTSPDKAILAEAKALDQKIKPKPGEITVPDPPSPPEWYAQLDPARLEGGAWFQPGKTSDGKRRIPFILPAGKYVKEQLVDCQPALIRGPFLAYRLDHEKQSVRVFKDRGKVPGVPAPGGVPGGRPDPLGFGGITGRGKDGNDNMVHKIVAGRMVVVSTVFPYAQQLELYRKALRKDQLIDLFDIKEPLAPKFLGLNVVRSEIQRDGKFGEWQKVYEADASGKSVPSPKFASTRKLLLEGVYDTTVPDQVGYYIVPGLVTPVPKLAERHAQVAFGDYPLLNLGEIKTKKDEVVQVNPEKKGPKDFPGKGIIFPGKFGKGGPKMPGGGPKSGGPDKTIATPQTDWVEVSELVGAERRMFTRRLKETVAFFNPLGVPTGRNNPFPAFVSGKDVKRQFKEGDPKKKIDAKDDDDDEDGPVKDFKQPVPTGPGNKFEVPEWCLVRFIDADVEPGKTYVYAVQVRLANPNFERQDVVAFPKLAEVKELASDGWLVVPPVTVPAEWDFYTVDQYVLDAEAKKHPAKGADTKSTLNHPELVALQIHKWLDKFVDRRLAYFPEEGDWVILERLLLRRGEPIAKNKVEVELPEWFEEKGVFELVGQGPSTKSRKENKDAIALDFAPAAGDPPLVVDFVGGVKRDYTLGWRSYVRDDSAVELLVLSPDGRLLLHNSSDDTNIENARGQARDEQYRHWQRRLQALNPNWRSGQASKR
jgi:hypothetical protein